MARSCGECLINDVEIVELPASGKCPRCGADYGPETSADRAYKTDAERRKADRDEDSARNGRRRR